MDRDEQIMERRRQGETYKAIADEFGLSQSRVSQIVRRKKNPIQGRHFYSTGWTLIPPPWDRLSGRAVNCCNYAGFLFTDDEFLRLQDAIRGGQFHWKLRVGRPPFARRKKIQNLGKKTFLEICEWAGVKPPEMLRQEQEPRPLREETIKTYIRGLERSGYVVTKKEAAHES